MIHHSKPNSMNENGFKKILVSQTENSKGKPKCSSYLNYLSNTEKSNKKNKKIKEKEKEIKSNISSLIKINNNNHQKKNSISLKTLDNNWLSKVTKKNTTKKKLNNKNLTNNTSISTELIEGNLNTSEININLNQNYSESNLNSKYSSEIIIKLNNEIMDYQLKNSRLSNEINILNEKMKSLNEIISIKETENEMFKSKYTSFMNELKTEITYLKNSNLELKKFKLLYDKMGITLKSLIKLLTDMFEFFLFNIPRTNSVRSNKSYTLSNLNTNNNNNNNSKFESSIDIYDSFNNEEERKIQLISQIQGLILSKYKSIQNTFSNISIEKEIDKIQNINFNSNISVINTLSNISNIIKVSKDNNDNSNSTSNDFDLSVSGTFYHQSPRFNSLENDTSNISNNNNKSIKKEGIISESLFNELKNSPINTFNNSYGSFCDFDISNKKKMVKSKSNNTSITKNININITSNYNSNNNSTKNKNFINILDCSFGDIITNDNEKIVKRPSLPTVQPNELSFDNNL